MIKDIEAKIIVCSDSTNLTFSYPEDLSTSLIVRQGRTEYLDVDTGLIETDDDDCPATSFSIVFSDEDPDNADSPTEMQAANVDTEEDDGSYRVRYYATDPGVFNYWVQAETVGGAYINKPGQLINICSQISQVITLADSGPFELDFGRNESPAV